MDKTVADRLREAHKDHPDAVFSLFTLSGHVISGRIAGWGETVVLEAGKEKAEVPQDRIEAFSLREV